MEAEHINTRTSTCTCMGSKSITISDEAYRYLKDIKGSRSFSEVILSLSRQGEGIMQYAGIFKEEDFKRVRNIRKEADHDWNRRRHKLAH